MSNRPYMWVLIVLIFQLVGSLSGWAGEEGENAGGGSASSLAGAGTIHRPPQPDRTRIPLTDEKTSSQREDLPALQRGILKLRSTAIALLVILPSIGALLDSHAPLEHLR